MNLSIDNFIFYEIFRLNQILFVKRGYLLLLGAIKATDFTCSKILLAKFNLFCKEYLNTHVANPLPSGCCHHGSSRAGSTGILLC
jgi:hypothetical protein